MGWEGGATGGRWSVEWGPGGTGGLLLPPVLQYLGSRIQNSLLLEKTSTSVCSRCHYLHPYGSAEPVTPTSR